MRKWVVQIKWDNEYEHAFKNMKHYLTTKCYCRAVIFLKHYCRFRNWALLSRDTNWILCGYVQFHSLIFLNHTHPLTTTAAEALLRSQANPCHWGAQQRWCLEKLRIRYRMKGPEKWNHEPRKERAFLFSSTIKLLLIELSNNGRPYC